MKQPRHSPHGFGVLSTEDVPFLKQSLLRIALVHGSINMIELGVANGGTTIGIYNWCKEKDVEFKWQGCDMAVGAPDFDLGSWGKFYEGDFHKPEIIEVVKDNVNLLFIDGCHCYNCVVDDFMLYSPKVMPTGYILFHDTCTHPEWQDHHIQCHPTRMIETRRALKDLSLCPLKRGDYEFIAEQNEGSTQGMMLFQKL